MRGKNGYGLSVTTHREDTPGGLDLPKECSVASLEPIDHGGALHHGGDIRRGNTGNRCQNKKKGENSHGVIQLTAPSGCNPKGIACRLPMG